MTATHRLLAGASIGMLAALGAAAGPGSPATAQPAPASGACAALSGAGLFSQTTVSTVQSVAADPTKGLPAYCEVVATVSPAAGSTIGVVYRLPEAWNGKLLGLGGGGWAGNTRIESAAQGLKGGYATAQTDGGHSAANVWDTSWAANPEAVTDFSYRAIHLMTVVGKEVAARYYGRPQQKAYFEGCSTGGRQGLMEVQRFPADYDGVISGAPVYSLQVQTSAVIRNQTFGSAQPGFDESKLQLVNQAALKACDAKDGLADGIITNPLLCRWDPGELRCKPGEARAQSCLSDSEVKALRTAYAGVKLSDGRVAAWPLARGGEVGWSRFMQISGTTRDATNGGGLGGLRGPILGDPNYDMSKFDAARDVPRIEDSAFAKGYDASDPAIGRFTSRGGKLLLWHGFYDPGPSPVGTIAYYDKVRAADPGAASAVRLFLAPGVYHCGGGPGPDQIDQLDALDAWVTTGRAPQTLLATKAGAKISRPLCPYPAMPHYKGAGDADAAASFECR